MGFLKLKIMALNIRRSQRTAPKKQNEDFIYAPNKDQNPRLPCKGCENVFDKREILLIHEAQCPRLKKDGSKPSSFKDQRPNDQISDPIDTEDTEDKLILSTQPLGPYNHRVG